MYLLLNNEKGKNFVLKIFPLIFVSSFLVFDLTGYVTFCIKTHLLSSYMPTVKIDQIL